PTVSITIKPDTTPTDPSKVITAASCSRTDVQAALNRASDGYTVVIPAGTCTWTTGITFKAPANFTLRGQTVCTGSANPGQNNLACTDNHTILDGIIRSASELMLSITTSATGTFRITGLTFGAAPGGSVGPGTGTIAFATFSPLFRMDHMHINATIAGNP